MASHIFGPVHSRRLGVSLGIDLIPFKTCPYDCVYCECSGTTNLATTRAHFFPVQEVLGELDKFLQKKPVLDYITFAGSGEPTLSLDIGAVIRYLKERYPAYRVAVLTNASLLSDPGVRRDLLAADVVLPTLTTVNETTYRKIHRPALEFRLKEILDGLVQFRKEYLGEIRLELFVIPGVNTADAELAGLREILREIKPDRVQLNTLDRPGTEAWVQPAGREELGRVGKMLEYSPVDIVDLQPCAVPGPRRPEDPEGQIRELLLRRPSTVGDLAAATGLHAADVLKILRDMEAAGRIGTRREERGVFYYPRK